MKLENLIVQDNFGSTHLKDVTVDEYAGVGYRNYKFVGHRVTGTIIGGGVTSRLFHATSFRPHPIGKVVTLDVYSHQIFKTSEGHYQVDTSTCG
jgi:hypothetical protein